MNQSIYEEVWYRLSRVDVGPHIQTVSGKYSYSYLPWHWAWATLMNYYPESWFKFVKDDERPDGTLIVNVDVYIKSADRQAVRSMFLPVMDHQNNPIKNPSARQVNDARMRCLVKCLALFGLGLDLWTGSDYPVGAGDDRIGPDELALLSKLLDKLPQESKEAFLTWAEVEELAHIPVHKYTSTRFQLERKIKSLSATKKRPVKKK